MNWKAFFEGIERIDWFGIGVKMGFGLFICISLLGLGLFGCISFVRFALI